MTQYVRITFLPAGAKRRRTVWAVKLAPGRYMRCNPEGETQTEVREGVVRSELILTRTDGGDVVERAAFMSNRYAMLDEEHIACTQAGKVLGIGAIEKLVEKFSMGGTIYLTHGDYERHFKKAAKKSEVK